MTGSLAALLDQIGTELLNVFGQKLVSFTAA
jgi:hypothetical protein